MAVGGVGAAPAAGAEGGIEPMGNPSFHCSNICSGFQPFLPLGGKEGCDQRREDEEQDNHIWSQFRAQTKNTGRAGWVQVVWRQKKEAKCWSLVSEQFKESM